MKRTIQELIIALALMTGLILMQIPMLGVFGVGLFITVVFISIAASMEKENKEDE